MTHSRSEFDGADMAQSVAWDDASEGGAAEPRLPAHDPKPWSPTGRIDSPVSCAVCKKYLYLGDELNEDGYLKWLHVDPSPEPVKDRADEILDALRNELDHAFFNNTFIADTAEPNVPGVRARFIEAVIERFTQKGERP